MAVDSPELRSILVAALRVQDYLVLEAADGTSALHTLQTHSRPIHLMLTNTTMDERFILEALKRYRPEMKVIGVPAKSWSQRRSESRGGSCERQSLF